MQWCTCSFASWEEVWNSWVVLTAWLHLMCPVSRRNDHTFKIRTSGLVKNPTKNSVRTCIFASFYSMKVFDVCVLLFGSGEDCSVSWKLSVFQGSYTWCNNCCVSRSFSSSPPLLWVVQRSGWWVKPACLWSLSF